MRQFALVPRYDAVAMLPVIRPSEFSHLIGEAVASFVKQRPAPLSRYLLLVMNDDHNEHLKLYGDGVAFAGPLAGVDDADVYFSNQNEIVVFNGVKRYGSLGEKYNAMVRIAREFLVRWEGALLPWEHDDISLPGRIATAVTELRTAGVTSYFNPKRYWFYQSHLDKPLVRCRDCSVNATSIIPEYTVPVGHMASAFTESAWSKAGGYPEDNKQDAGLDREMMQFYTPPIHNNDPSTLQYIYRWGVSKYHLSTGVDTIWQKFQDTGKGVKEVDVKCQWLRPWDAVVANHPHTLSYNASVEGVPQSCQ